MGDRALIIFHDKDKKDFSPVIYLHWHGSQVKELLEKALPRLRQGDINYAAARLIGVCHEQIEGALSLGISNAPRGEPSEVWAKVTSYDYSAGDAGVFLVDVDTWKVQAYHGYGFGDGVKELQLDASQACQQ